MVPDSDPGLSDIEVSSVESGDISDIGETENGNDSDDLGEVQGGTVNDQDDNTANTAQNLTWTTNFRDVVVDAFEQVTGPNLPPGFDTTTAKPLDYFEFLSNQKCLKKL